MVSNKDIIGMEDVFVVGVVEIVVGIVVGIAVGIVGRHRGILGNSKGLEKPLTTLKVIP